MFVEVIISGKICTAQLDSACDATIISAVLLDKLCPEWDRLQDAGELRIMSHTHNLLDVIKCVWLPVRFSDNLKELTIKVAVTKDSEEVFLLSSEFIVSNKLSIVYRYRDDGYYLCFPSYFDARELGREIEIPIAHRPFAELGQNLFQTKLQKLEVARIEFVVNNCQEDDLVVCDSPTEAFAYNNLIAICPTITSVRKVRELLIADVIVQNLMDHDVTIPQSKLFTDVEVLTEKEDFQLFQPNAESTVNSFEIKRMCELMLTQLDQAPGNICLTRKVVAVHPYQRAAWCCQNSVEEGELEFDLKVGEGALFTDTVEEKSPIERIDFEKIEPQYHKYVRYLFTEAFPNLLAKHQYDCGDISKTLGYLYVPLKEALPKTRKMFYSSPRDQEQLHAILESMLKYGLIRRSNSTFGAPVFLIRRKTGQAALRLLCAVVELNKAVQKPVSVLPNIQRVLEGLSQDGVSLASCLDLASGFYALSIHPKHQGRVTILTPFGCFAFKRALMGLTHVPHVYNSKINQAINTDPETGKTSPLTISYMDDVPITTPCMGDPQLELESHYESLYRVLYRLNFHGFKLGPSKLSLFHKRAHILGHVLEGKKISVDPKRIEKMLEAPPITNKKTAQKWCGFLASIKHFSPIDLGQQHAILSELTGDVFEKTERHEQAFAKVKEALASKEFILDVPDQRKVKVLYTDSSGLAAGAILLQVAWEIEVKTDISPPYTHFDKDDPLEIAIKELQLDLKLDAKPEFGGDSFVQAYLRQLKLLRIENFPKTVIEMRASLVALADMYPHCVKYRNLVEQSGEKWSNFLEKHATKGTPMDKLGIMLACSAELVFRDVHLVILRQFGGKIKPIVEVYKGADSPKPPIWIGFYPPKGNKPGTYVSLINRKANDYTKFTSAQYVEGELAEMTQQNVLEKVKTILAKKGTKQKLQVIAYFSKVIAKKDRIRAIWELEAMGLISALNAFKEYIQGCPCVVTLIDSRVAYFLFSPGVYLSEKKCRRWNVLLETEYTNLVFQLIPSGQNWADLFTRMYEAPEEVVSQIAAKNIHIGPIATVPETLLTFAEMHQFGRDNPQYLQDSTDIPKTFKTKAAISRKLSSLEKIIDPVMILRDRLTPADFLEAQKNDPDLHFRKASHLGIDRNGLSTYKEKIMVPEELEGLLIAYLHLLTGHNGSEKLLKMLHLDYFMIHATKKVRSFVSNCQSCLVVNSLSERKVPLGTFPVPKYPFETVFMDLLEGMPKNRLKISFLLVVTCYLTKNIFIFPLKSKTSQAVLDNFKLLFQFTGGAIRYLYTDNGTCFREKKFVEFMAGLGILLAKTTPYSSKSRGAVEKQNHLITALITKLLLNEDSYDFTDVYFLTSVMLNGSFHPAINAIPSEVIFGNNPVMLGPLSNDINAPIHDYRLLKGDLATKAQERRLAMQQKLVLVRESLEEHRRKYLDKANKNKKQNLDIMPGDIVFVKNFSLVVGQSIKLRPRLYKSPFVVLSLTEQVVLVSRLVDGYEVQVHLDYVRKYKVGSEQYNKLPKEVQDIVGLGVNKETFLELAKKDMLPLLYVDRIAAQLEPMVTRGQAARKGRDADAEPDEEALDESEDDLDPYFKKVVQFLDQPTDQSSSK